MNVLTSTFHIRRLMLRRAFREIPLPYYLFFGAGLWVFLYNAAHAAIPFTPRYAAAAACAYVALYVGFFRNQKRALFLRQLGSAGALFSAMDMLACALPFLLVGIFFFLLTLAVGALCLMGERLMAKCGARSALPWVMPSVFLKPSYLWHSQSRPYLTLYWIFLGVVLFFACKHANFNLAIVAFCSVSAIAITSVMLQQESISFIRQYCNIRHFTASMLLEACANTTLFLLAPAACLLAAFPLLWKATALATLAIYYLSANLQLIRVLFWGVSPFITLLFVGIFLYVQGILIYSAYGIPVALLFQYLLYKKYYSSAKRLLCHANVER
ncbi:MAG: hypothetical protein LBO71_01635 [Prevotellaceae bacterium]|jgi:hypothetical protein|nr:hypothetical protein [Prevotellaceae bacterium]